MVECLHLKEECQKPVKNIGKMLIYHDGGTIIPFALILLLAQTSGTFTVLDCS